MGTLIQIPEKPGSVSPPAVWKNSLNFSHSPGCAGQSEGSLKAEETQPELRLPSLLPAALPLPLPTTLAWFPEFDASYLFSESLYSPLVSLHPTFLRGFFIRVEAISNTHFQEKLTKPMPLTSLTRRPPGQKSEQVPDGVILVKFSEDDRINTSPEPIII